MANVIKDPCEQYYVEVDGHSWGTFTISPKGDFFLHSDWGYWAFNWRAFGDDFKGFLTRINEYYLLDKLEANQFTHKGIRSKISSRQKVAITELFKAFQQALKEECLVVSR